MQMTPLLIDRLKTDDIDNFYETAEKFPNIFEEIYRDLKSLHYWSDVRYEVAHMMCMYLTINNEKVALTEFSKFFKTHE